MNVINIMNETDIEKIIFIKNDIKLTMIEKNKYILNFEFTNPNSNINLENIINFNLFKLIFDINKNDILEDFNLTMHSDSNGILYILIKHFFDDFGISQKYVNLDITLQKNNNKFIFNCITNYDFQNHNYIPNTPTCIIPINIESIFEIITPNKVLIKNTIIFEKMNEIPEFIEKIAITIICKIITRIKNFICKINL